MLKTILQASGLKFYLIAAAVLVSVLSGGYLAWKRSVQQDAVAQWTMQQLKQIAEDQRRFAEQQREMLETAKELRIEMAQKQKALEDKLGPVEKWIESSEAAKSDRPSSQLLKETVRRLGGQK
jgi:hypothetical protein